MSVLRDISNGDGNLTRQLLFLVEPGREWIGGVYYVRNILKTLSFAPWFQECFIHVLVRKEFRETFAMLANDIAHFQLHDRREAKPLLERLTTPFLKRLGKIYDVQIAHVARQIQADLVFPVSFYPFLGVRGTQVHWIPDFQELHLPQYFSASELEKRARLYRGIAKGTNPLILSSRSSQADWERCAPTCRNRTWILPFISDIEAEIAGLDAAKEAALLDEVGLWSEGAAKPYVYVPNQFWQHKNHELVLDALELLQKRGASLPTVVCTGNVADHRSKDHATHIWARVEASGLAESFRILSMVRRPQQLAIMKNARAVLQPSRFEGWNTGIMEAMRLGRPLLMSSLDVHREQAPEDAHFFAPDSAVQLADLLGRDWPESRVSEAILKERNGAAAVRFVESVRELFLGTELMSQ